MKIKPLLFVSLLAPAIALASPCDGRKVLISVYSESNHKVIETDPRLHSALEIIRPGLMILGGTTAEGHIFSDSGSLGSARGRITLESQTNTQDIIEIDYSCVKLPLGYTMNSASVHSVPKGTNVYSWYRDGVYNFEVYH